MYESAPQNEPVVPPELSEDGATYAEVARWNEQQVAYAETLATDPAFTRTLYRAASRRGSQSPDDLVQDAIIKTINGVRDIDTAISFAGRLGTQLAIDQHRRRVSKARVEDLFGRLHAPLILLKTVEDEALDAVQGDIVRESVDQLVPEQRVLIKLVYFDGLSFTEAAALLGIPKGTAKSRIRKAYQDLKPILASRGITGVS